MNILVTGSSGTLGGYVLRELIAAGHTVTDYSLMPCRVEGVTSIPGDVLNLDQLKDACRGRDAIIHLAGIPGPGRATPLQMINLNVGGTVHALEAAVQMGVPKLVLASSGAATGFTFQKHDITPRYLPLDEEHPCEPHDEYGLSKLLAEIACKRYTDAFGLRTICLRINHNWYVDRPGAEAAVGVGWATRLTSVEELWTARYLKTLNDPEGDWPIPGPPRPRNLLWAVTDARDAAQAFRLAVENSKLKHEVFLINGDDTCSLEETPKLIARWFPNVPLKKPLTGFDTLLSHDKATRLLGYQPRYTWRNSDFRRWLEGLQQ